MSRGVQALPAALLVSLASLAWPTAAGARTTDPPASEVVELVRGAYVYAEPVRRGTHGRGKVGRGARFAVLERARGKGCTRDWLRIARAAWICARHTRPSQLAPGGVVLPRLAPGKLLPYSYVLTHHAHAYETLDDAAAGTVTHRLWGQGGYRVTRSAERAGQRFLHTAAGWVAAAEARRARAPEFAGVTLAPATRRLGFVVARDGAPVYTLDGGRHADAPLPRHTVLPEVGEPIALGERTFYPIGGDRLLRADDVGRVRLQPPPAEVGADQRWLDVDLEEQTLVAYQGGQAVFATLVSTANKATPEGLHRIARKRPLVRMRAQPQHIGQYDLETAWVMTLAGRIAMHAVYWHDDFGVARSHGCVNLSPRDARWLWEWTSPALPPGWLRIDETEDEPGTWVNVHR